jgi:metal-dependent amidase/aminoacylase/carboxypeptidase family protein
MIINLYGKESHAAEPEQGINPALAVSEILRDCLAMSNNNDEDDDMRVITPVCIELGEKAYGISAGNASIHFTLRCWNDKNLQRLEKEIESVCKKISGDMGLKTGFEYLQTFHASDNDPEAVDLVRKAANTLRLSVIEKKYPFKWGEDFGLFTSRFKGCMFGLGAGENIPALHNPDYDFPDELIVTGVNMYTEIIKQLTN